MMSRFAKQTFFCLILGLWPVGLWAFEIPENLRQLLAPHVEKIVTALPALEQEFAATETEYRQCLAGYEAMQLQLESSNLSMAKKASLKIKLTYQTQRVAEKRDDFNTQRRRLIIYRCLMHAFEKKTMTAQTLTEARKALAELEGFAAELDQKIQKAQERERQAVERLSAIVVEQEQAQERVQQLRAQLAILEDKKSWSNAAERMQLQSQIAYQQSLLLKLKAETALMKKAQTDAQKDGQGLTVEKSEVAVALLVLRQGN